MLLLMNVTHVVWDVEMGVFFALIQQELK